MSEISKTIVTYKCDSCGKIHDYKDLMVAYTNNAENFTWHFCDHMEAIGFLADRHGYVKRSSLSTSIPQV